MKSLSLLIVFVPFFIGSSPQSKSGANGMVRKVESFSTWNQHRDFLVSALDSDRHRDVVRAYVTLYSKKKRPNDLAGLSRAYRRWFYLHRAGVESEAPPSDVGSVVRVGFEQPSSKRALSTIVEAYLFEQLMPPPPLPGDPMRNMSGIGPDGSSVQIPVFDGKVALQRRKKTLMSLAQLAIKVAPNDPEAQYLTALEMPAGPSRAERIGNLVRQNREVFGYAGLYTAWYAAKEARSPSAPQWQSELLASLAAMPDGKTKRLMRRLYPIPGVKNE